MSFSDITETDYDNPLPPPKAASDLLKSNAYSAIQKWYDKFGEEYKRLTLGFNFLKTCKKVGLYCEEYYYVNKKKTK